MSTPEKIDNGLEKAKEATTLFLKAVANLIATEVAIATAIGIIMTYPFLDRQLILNGLKAPLKDRTAKFKEAEREWRNSLAGAPGPDLPSADEIRQSMYMKAEPDSMTFVKTIMERIDTLQKVEESAFSNTDSSLREQASNMVAQSILEFQNEMSWQDPTNPQRTFS